MKIVLFNDIVETNDKTIYQNNMDKNHNIPIGTLVEVNSPDEPYNKIRLYVVKYTRDCDGEPLYSLGFNGETNPYMMHPGFSEDCLTEIDCG